MEELNNYSDLDADINHFKQLYPGLSSDDSDYYDTRKFNEVICKGSNDFAVVHFDKRSLYPKFNDLIAELSELNCNFDAI